MDAHTTTTTEPTMYDALLAAVGKMRDHRPAIRRVYVWGMVPRGKAWMRDGYMGIHPADWRLAQWESPTVDALGLPARDPNIFMGAPVVYVDGDSEARSEAVRNLVGLDT